MFLPAYFGAGALVDMHLAYLMTRVPLSPPCSLVQTHPFVQESVVVFGIPDILFQPIATFVQLALGKQPLTPIWF